MFADQRLAIAFGALSPRDTAEDSAESRKLLVRAGEAMVDAGMAVVVNKAGTKIPICTLISKERKDADQAAMDVAAAKGDPNAHKRRHRCGLAHAITDRKTATRVLGRIARHEAFNLGVEPRASRVLIVDIDTRGQGADFALRSGSDRPAYTVRSPGQRDAAGNWVHSNGGHIWFEVPPGVELPVEDGIYVSPAGWSAIWGEHQVLVPPSTRAEGPYTLVGSMYPLPEWLHRAITTAVEEKARRRAEARRRRAELGPSAIDDWATETPWADILEPDGWVETQITDNCGCPVWTAPGDHASPKSATAHEVGCAIYVCERGHGPLHVWTDNPGITVTAAVTEYGSRTLTKIQVITHTEGDGRMGRTMRDLGIENDRGPTIISVPFATWDQEKPRPESPAPPTPTTPPSTPSAGVEDRTPATSLPSSEPRIDPLVDDEGDDEDPEETIADAVTPEMLFERKVRKEYEYELVRRAALDRLAAQDAPPFRTLRLTELLKSPRPEQLIPDMLYRDSLTRIFGAPGSAKSFLALDLAMSISAGRFWNGVKLRSETVVYVMAEGQRVNGDRAEAWLSKNRVRPEDIDDKFISVPDAVMLTEAASTELIKLVEDAQPALVVLDTKNAMMVGEENSATDFAVMRRVLDRIRKASNCCVVLVDHTGHEGTRARGSSAGTAAMDTEVRVVKDDSEKPSMVTAEVTRDKAGEAGTRWAWRLLPEHPGAVLDRTELPEPTDDRGGDWLFSKQALPEPVESYDGHGSKVVTDLARLMIFYTIPQHDRSQIGMTLTEAKRALKERLNVDPKTVVNAWSWLKDKGYLVSTYEEPTAVQDRSGPHVWEGPSGLSAVSETDGAV